MSKKCFEEINNFDNVLKTYQERKDFVEKTHKTIIDNDTSIMVAAMNNTNVAKALENQATYLLNSCDVESGRKQEYAYYRDDKDYKSNYAIGENTIYTDNLEDFERYLASRNNVEIPVNADRLDIEKMTPEHKKRFLKYGVNNLDGLSDVFKSKIKVLIDNIEKEAKDDTDRTIIYGLINGKTELTIARELGISRRSVNKRLNKLCK